MKHRMREREYVCDTKLTVYSVVTEWWRSENKGEKKLIWFNVQNNAIHHQFITNWLLIQWEFYTFPWAQKFRRKRDLSTKRLATAMPFTGISLLNSFACSLIHLLNSKNTRVHFRNDSFARSLAHPYHLKWAAHNPIRLGLIKIHQNGIYLLFFSLLCSMYLNAAYAFVSTTQSHLRVYVRLQTIKWFISIAIEIKIQIPIRTPHTQRFDFYEKWSPSRWIIIIVISRQKDGLLSIFQ